MGGFQQHLKTKKSVVNRLIELTVVINSIQPQLSNSQNISLDEKLGNLVSDLIEKDERKQFVQNYLQRRNVNYTDYLYVYRAWLDGLLIAVPSYEDAMLVDTNLTQYFRVMNEYGFLTIESQDKLKTDFVHQRRYVLGVIPEQRALYLKKCLASHMVVHITRKNHKEDEKYYIPVTCARENKNENFIPKTRLPLFRTVHDDLFRGWKTRVPVDWNKQKIVSLYIYDMSWNVHDEHNIFKDIIDCFNQSEFCKFT